MYFKFHENLPASVIRAVFDLYTIDDLDRTPYYLCAGIHDKSAMVHVPEQATHVRSICFFTPTQSFTYYYPAEGYALAGGGHLPPLKAYAVGDLYAGGLVMQTGIDRPDLEIEADILPYKGKIIALEEQIGGYREEKNEGHFFLPECDASLAADTCTPWHLPDILELATIYRHQAALNELLLLSGGMPLCPENYWCRDNSVIELGVAFHMATGRPSIVSKEERHRIRLVRGY